MRDKYKQHLLNGTALSVGVIVYSRLLHLACLFIFSYGFVRINYIRTHILITNYNYIVNAIIINTNGL